jgi:hypothetical protein
MTLIQMLFFVQLASTGFMTGLIWFVQIVHYPLFSRVPDEAFRSYEQAHTVLTGRVVAVPMLLEALSTVALFALAPTYPHSWVSGIGLGLLGLIWLSTAALQMPCHQGLSRGFMPHLHRRLVLSNWIRTLSWSLRALLLLSALRLP